MDQGRNPLDLNNLPEDYVRDGKQLFIDIITTEASDTTRCRRKKSGGKDECGKVYECRFCSLKFCKSQALGGHMNRHRQERETETLNRARQLVFGNDNLAPQPSPHLGLRDLSLGGAQPGSFHHHHQSGSNINNGGDPSISLPYRSVYPTTRRLFSSSSGSSSPNILSPPVPPQPAPHPYASPSPPSRMVSFPHQVNDYYVGHVLTGSSNRHHHQLNPSSDSSSYTCIGAPLGRDFGQPHSDGGGIRGMDLSTSSVREDDSLRSWDRSSYGSTTQCSDPPLINRFHDRF